MALITRTANASIDVISADDAPQLADGLIAGEDLDLAAPCYIKNDGLVYMTNGTAANAAALCDGFTPRFYSAGHPVTLFGVGTKFEYGSGLTPGARFYAAATKGRLDSAPTTGGTVAIAKAINDHCIVVIANQ